MQTFSVWNLGTRRYDYYQGGEHDGTHITQADSHLLATSRIGLTPDEFATRLPQDVKLVGSGDEARGRVASLGDGHGRLTKLVILGAAALFAWRYLR